MRYQPTPAWLGACVLMLVMSSTDIGHSAPRRPSNSASACSISADKFNQLAAWRTRRLLQRAWNLFRPDAGTLASHCAAQ